MRALEKIWARLWSSDESMVAEEPPAEEWTGWKRMTRKSPKVPTLKQQYREEDAHCMETRGREQESTDGLSRKLSRGGKRSHPWGGMLPRGQGRS